MISGQTIRAKRMAADIPGEVVSLRLGIDRGRLSRIERGRISASAEELARIHAAIDELVLAKRQIANFAASVGWPVSEAE